MSRYSESAADYGTPTQPTQPLPMDSDLMTCFDRVKNLIPDYEWTCIYKSGDLIHIPTGIILSSDVNGYELHNNSTHRRLLFAEDANTTDPREAVVYFVAEVVQQIAYEYIEGKM